jgi:dTDP-4-dehydrorhamnose reductase
MNILITGANGQVGAETGRCAWPTGWRIARFDRQALNITDESALSDAADRVVPDLIVNLAAYTAVDCAESESVQAFAVNRDGPANLAGLCAQRRIALFHVSTDYVFDGSKRGPYLEDDPVGPLGVYGASKEAGESAIRRALDRHLILRTAWVYGAHGRNFVKTMLRVGGERDTLRVVADQIGTPTWAADIARTLAYLAQAVLSGTERWGTYHYTGAGETSWAGFADAIFEFAAPMIGRRPAVIPIGTADYPTAARRPPNSRLDCGKIAREFGIVARPWQEGLKSMLSELQTLAARETP